MSVPMSQVLATARTLLNDDNSTVFTDVVLIPKIQEAHRELQNELWLNGSPIVRAEIGAGAAIYTGFLIAPIADLLAPTEVFEYTGATTLPLLPMTEVNFLPLQNGFKAPPIGIWCWRGEQLTIPPPTIDIPLLVRYRRSIPIPVIATDLIGILSGEQYLAARAAALAAGTLGNKEALDSLTAMATVNLSKVLMSNRGSQKPLNRP